MLRRLLLATALLVPTFSAFANEPDHPLLKRYPNADVRSYRQVDYEKTAFPNGLPNAEDTNQVPMLEMVGDITRHTYTIDHVSTLKLYENYRQALKQLGFNLLFSCETSQCGTEDQAAALGALVSIDETVYNFYRKPYYLLAEKSAAKGKVYIALFIGGYTDESWVFQNIVEEEPLDISQIQTQASYLQNQPAPTPPPANNKVTPGEDHPLLSRYPGASVRKRVQVDYESYSMPVGVTDAAGHFPTLDLTGDLTRHIYEVSHISTLKLYENYRSALSKAGFKTLFQCELDACGKDDALFALGAAASNEDTVYNYYHKPYYLVAEQDSPKGKIYVGLFIGGYLDDAWVFQNIVETKPLETDLVQVNVDGLQRDLEATGKALIYGIYFDTDQAVIKPESKPTLDVIAELLQKHADLKLYVVGHTDDSGAVAHNEQLSKARASAVVDKLVKDYRVAATRLIAQGVGPYAPADSNLNDTGKQHNRRVELVQRLN